MNICIIGTGYVGLVTGTCFAEMGNQVWCVDIDREKIDNLNKGIMPIYEPGLKEMVLQNLKASRLKFTTDIREGLVKSLIAFIAVGTPPGEDGSADVSHVLHVAKEIGQNLDKYMIIVDKSTVPVGTAEQVRTLVQEELDKRGWENLEFDIVSNPEFLKEGAAIEDFMRPDRVVIGTDNVRTAELMKQLYDPFVRNGHPVLIMDINSAELTKYAANAMLATRISFMNEMARLCDKVGADVNQVRKGIGTDNRIGMPFLYAGAGYGGSCFPKDVKELIAIGYRQGEPMEIVQAVERSNEKQKVYLADMVIRRFGKDLSGLTFGIWGLAFKPQTDDMREAPSIAIIEALVQRGANIAAYDPEATEQAKRVFSKYQDKIRYTDDMYAAVHKADALILVTEWRQFRQPDLNILKGNLLTPIVFDGRNQYEPNGMEQEGFEYYSIGRNCYVK